MTPVHRQCTQQLVVFISEEQRKTGATCAAASELLIDMGAMEIAAMPCADDWKAAVQQDAEKELHLRQQESQYSTAISALTMLR